MMIHHLPGTTYNNREKRLDRISYFLSFSYSVYTQFILSLYSVYTQFIVVVVVVVVVVTAATVLFWGLQKLYST